MMALKCRLFFKAKKIKIVITIMAKKYEKIDFGTGDNTPTGDTINAGFKKINTALNDIENDIKSVESDLIIRVNNVESDLITRIYDVDTNLSTRINDVDSTLTTRINDLENELITDLIDLENELVTTINTGDASLNNKIDTVNSTLSTRINDVDSAIDNRIATQISELVDGAPTTFDTFKEIADWIESDGIDVVELTSAIALKADKTELVGLATETFVTDVINTIPEADLSSYETIVDNDIKLNLKADKTEVQQQFDALVIPSILGLATETYVSQKLTTIPASPISLAGNGGLFRTGRDEALSNAIGTNGVDFSHQIGNDKRGASGNYAIALGAITTASASYSFAHGAMSTANGYFSFASGDNVKSSGSFSYSFGEGTHNNAYGCTALGYWNTPIVTTGQSAVVTGSPLLIVGNGTQPQRKNAYVLYNDGKSTQSGIASYDADYSNAFTTNSLVSKKYVDDSLSRFAPTDKIFTKRAFYIQMASTPQPITESNLFEFTMPINYATNAWNSASGAVYFSCSNNLQKFADCKFELYLTDIESNELKVAECIIDTTNYTTDIHTINQPHVYLKFNVLNFSGTHNSWYKYDFYNSTMIYDDIAEPSESITITVEKIMRYTLRINTLKVKMIATPKGGFKFADLMTSFQIGRYDITIT